MSGESLWALGLTAEQVAPIEATPEELSAKLEAVAVAVREGLSLHDAAASQRIGHRRLAAFVILGEDGAEPWATWLAGICADASRARAETLRALSEMATIDAGAARDLQRLSGAATELQRALSVLRRVDSAHRDAKAEKLRASESRRGREPLPPSWAANRKDEP